jgi:hypothetical protein
MIRLQLRNQPSEETYIGGRLARVDTAADGQKEDQPATEKDERSKQSIPRAFSLHNATLQSTGNPINCKPDEAP